MKLLLVEWVDSSSLADDQWKSLARIAEKTDPVLCRSVGWLVADTKECKVIVPHISGEKNEGTMPYGCGEMSIPKCAIKRVRVLQKS